MNESGAEALRRELSKILTEGRLDRYGETDEELLDGVRFLMRMHQDAVAACTPLFQSGGRWAHLLSPGQSITTDGPVALSRYTERLGAALAEVTRVLEEATR